MTDRTVSCKTTTLACQSRSLTSANHSDSHAHEAFTQTQCAMQHMPKATSAATSVHKQEFPHVIPSAEKPQKAVKPHRFMALFHRLPSSKTSAALGLGYIVHAGNQCCVRESHDHSN